MEKIGETRYSVEYNFFSDGVPERIKMGFETEAEAQAWAVENTTDGKVEWYRRIW